MLTAGDFPVTPDVMERKLQVLVAGYFGRPQQGVPEIVYVAGQPASGKSTVIETVRRGHAVLDSDEVRKLHPALDQIMRVDPLRMDVLTNGPVPYWMSSLIEHGRAHGRSMIIENTLSNPDFIAEEIGKFRAAGFHVKLIGLAVAAEVSRLGVVQRFLEARRVSVHPRWTNEVSHTNGYNAIVPGLRALAPLADEVLIRTRDGRDLTSVDEIEYERAHWFDSLEIRADWLARFDSCDLSGLEGEKLTQNLLADAERIRAL